MKKLLVGTVLAAAVLLVLGGCFPFCFPFNDKPIASFSWSPSTVYAGAKIFFDGSPSYDSDGTVESYSWTFKDNGVVLKTLEGKKVTFVFPDDGQYNVELTVTDDRGGIGCEEQLLNVLNPAPTIGGLTIRDIDSPSCCHKYVCDRIEAVLQNVVDPAGIVPAPRTIVSAVIDWGDGATSPGYRAIHRYKSPGCYTVVARVTDDDGAVALKSKTVLIEECPLVPPVVELFPRTSSVSLGTMVRFRVEAYDPDQYCDYCTPCPPPCQNERPNQALLLTKSCLAKNEPSGIIPTLYSDGIVRIQVNVENPHGDVWVLEGVTNFSVEFNIPGTWIIRGIVWDDDCGCSHSATFTHRVEVYIP